MKRGLRVTVVRMRLLEQGLSALPGASVTASWVPTAPAKVGAGVVLPSPKTQAIPAGSATFTVEPCDGTGGWYWQVTITADGVVRDQRIVLVPDTPFVEYENLQVLGDNMRSLAADQVWVGLEDNPPPAWFRGWWLVSAPGNPAIGDNTGSGDLRRVL